MSKEEFPTFNFENALTDLSALIEQMEKGQLTLEQSLHQFEKGVNLIRQCQQVLRDAEQKVSVLIEQQEGLQPYSMIDTKE